MELHLSGKSAFITGGSQGIGLAIARTLGTEGVATALLARNPEALDHAARQVREVSSAPVVAVAADVMDTESLLAAFETAQDQLGGIDIVVNNAGGMSTFGDFDALSDSDWEEVFEWNLLAPVRLIRAALPGMRARDWGRIINIGSESGVQPDAFFPHYAAMKSALMTLTKSLSKALAGTGIRANVVSPAFVKTPILERMLADYAEQHGVGLAEGERMFLSQERPNITARRAGRPEEVAAVVAMLCSPVADFVNGSNYRVDSGSVSTI